MPSNRFQTAAAQAASRYTADAWSTLSPSARAAAIYLELRKLDAESAEASRSAEVEASAADKAQDQNTYSRGSSSCRRPRRPR